MEEKRERGVCSCSLSLSLSCALSCKLEHCYLGDVFHVLRSLFFSGGRGGGGLIGVAGLHLFGFPEFQVSGLIWQEMLELVAKKRGKKEKENWSNYVIGL